MARSLGIPRVASEVLKFKLRDIVEQGMLPKEVIGLTADVPTGDLLLRLRTLGLEAQPQDETPDDILNPQAGRIPDGRELLQRDPGVDAEREERERFEHWAARQKQGV